MALYEPYDNTAPFYRVIYNRTFFGRYDRYTIPGFILLLFGVTVIGLSVADVTYTTLHYGSNCNLTGAPAGLKPCSGQHFYTYIASGIWGGLLLFANGIFALHVPTWTISYSWVFRGHATLVIINTFIIAPLIIVLNALEITQNNGIFYLNGANNQIVMCVDQVKLILPIAIAIIAGLTEILLFFMLAIFLCCKTPSNRPRFQDEPTYQRDPRADSFWNNRDSYRSERPSEVMNTGYDYPRQLVPSRGPARLLYPMQTPLSSYNSGLPRPVLSTNPYGFHRSTALNAPRVGGVLPQGRFWPY